MSDIYLVIFSLETSDLIFYRGMQHAKSNYVANEITNIAQLTLNIIIREKPQYLLGGKKRAIKWFSNQRIFFLTGRLGRRTLSGARGLWKWFCHGDSPSLSPGIFWSPSPSHCHWHPALGQTVGNFAGRARTLHASHHCDPLDIALECD